MCSISYRNWPQLTRRDVATELIRNGYARVRDENPTAGNCSNKIEHLQQLQQQLQQLHKQEQRAKRLEIGIWKFIPTDTHGVVAAVGSIVHKTWNKFMR